MDYLAGTDALVGAAGKQYLLIDVIDISEAAKQQAGGGATGDIVARGLGLAKVFAPNTLSNFTMDKFATEMRTEMAKKGVVADVSVIATLPPHGARPPSDFLSGLAVGLLPVAGYGLWCLIKWGFFPKTASL